MTQSGSKSTKGRVAMYLYYECHNADKVIEVKIKRTRRKSKQTVEA